MLRVGLRKLLVLVGASALLAGFVGTGVGSAARSSDAAHAGSDPYKVGIVYSRTGLLSAYGAEYIEGLRYGIAYATHGTGAVNGHKLALTIVDDAGDPSKAVSAGKELIGAGYHILAGSTSSGVALQMASLADQNRVLFVSGAAATDAITGANRYTFRSGRQTYQDILAANSFLRGSGKKVTVFAQDTAFGNGNYAAVNAVLGGRGHHVSKVVVPLSASDFTPFAQQVKQANPDLLFVAWAGTTAPAMWRALDQQGVFGVANKVVTGLAERASWGPAFGPVATKIQFLSHYVSTAPKNKVNAFLVRAMHKRGQAPDLFTPDGFVAGQMIVHALQAAHGDSVDKMISALEGWNFVGPKGQMSIRPQDHALIQPMFQVKLTQKNGHYVPVLLKTLARVTPPVVPFK